MVNIYSELWRIRNTGTALMKHHQDLFYTPPIQDGINDSVQEFMQIIYMHRQVFNYLFK